MPRNKKEGILYGTCICLIMAYFMGLINMIIHTGITSQTLVNSLLQLPVTFLIAYLLQNFVISGFRNKLVKRFTAKTDSENAKTLFNTFFTVTMMSLIMTFIGGLLGGQSVIELISNYPSLWPRNFCIAFFLNILVALPFAKLVLKTVRNVKENYSYEAC